MKAFARLFSALMTGLVLSSPTRAFARGNEGSGGGDTVHRSAIDVRNYLENLSLPGVNYHDFESAFRRVRYILSPSSSVPVRDPRARAILQRISDLAGPSSTGTWPGWNSRYRISYHVHKTGPCHDEGKPHDAAVTVEPAKTYSWGTAPANINICLSSERLSRFSYEELQFQLPILILHELAHVAGYGEEDAVYVQNYLLKKFDEKKKCSVQLVVTNANPKARFTQFDVEIDADGYGNVWQVEAFDRPGDQQYKVIETRGSNSREEIEFHWASDGPGKLKFKSASKDESDDVVQEVSWNFTRGITSPLKLFYPEDFRDIRLSIDGKSVQPKFFRIENCD